MWQRGQAVSIAERCGQFEPNLLTMHGDTQTHDIRAATTGLTRVWQPFPLFSWTLITAPASEYYAPQTPVPDRVVLTRALASLPLCQLEGEHVSRDGSRRY